MNTIVFDKQKTSIIKGFAIVMMILLHCFGGQGWYDNHLPAMDNAQLISFMGSFKFCVAIYAFMVGFGYNFAKSKDLRYSISHIIKLLIPAWVIIVLFSFPFAHSLNAEIVIKNLFGINSSLHWLSWFIYFYIITILLMPVISRVLKEHTLMKGVILIGVLFVCGILSGKYLGRSNNEYIRCLIAILAYVPLVIEGYVFANINIFNTLPPHSMFTSKKSHRGLLGILLIIISVFLRSIPYGSLFELILTPTFIYGILLLFQDNEDKIYSRIFIALGIASVWMWFVHGLFFTKEIRHIYQPIILISDNVWIISLWVILLSYVAAFLMMKSHKIIEKWIKSLF